MTTLQTLAEQLRAACLLEATARKPGNVHPETSFPDLTYADFVRSAEAAAPVLARAEELGVGRTIFEAVAATRQAAPSNTNLGMILLLAPLAAIPAGTSLCDGIGTVLRTLTVEDAVWAYRGIRLAQPGGMGEQSEQDLTAEPTVTLREAMALAADRDLIASQYITNFSVVLTTGFPLLCREASFEERWEEALISLQLHLMAEYPDSLIARTCGVETALEARLRAQQVLTEGWPGRSGSAKTLHDFDQWLRADGHRRNPGTTADLIAASLFAALRDGRLPCPGWVSTLSADGSPSA